MLTLPIKKKWYDMILSGEKKEEYREIKPYYTTRFANSFHVVIWYKEPAAPKKPPKHKHGDYGHVLLTDQELEKLNAEYGINETAAAIKYLDEYIEMKGFSNFNQRDMDIDSLESQLMDNK